MAASHIPPPAQVTLQDLEELAHLLPPTAHALVRCAGPAGAVALLQTWPGVLFPCPKHPQANAEGARRWAQIAEVAGEAAMPGLVAEYGGSLVDVPTCKTLLVEKRNRWIRARFDDLVNPHSGAMTAAAALREVAIALAQAGQPMTSRELEKIVNRSDVAPQAQPDLFAEPAAQPLEAPTP